MSGRADCTFTVALLRATTTSLDRRKEPVIDLFPLDIPSLLHDSLRQDRRVPDGLLHASSDLVGSLRHSQLRAAGAPTLESELVSDITLMTGTLWHKFIAAALVARGIPFMQEVNLTPWMPGGWSGTADWIFWHPAYQAFVLGDLKTTKGEAIRWLKQASKPEHHHQLSAYWYALRNMGIPLVERFGVLYIPKNNVPGEQVEPVLHELQPLDEVELLRLMVDRWAATEAYLSGGELAPVQERVQTYRWDSAAGVFQVQLVPHWSAAYCPYPNELCDCNTTGTTKIGHYTREGEYVARRGYEDVLPLVCPTPLEISKRSI